MFVTVMIVAFPIAAIVAIVTVLVRRNRVQPGARVSGVVYLTQIVGATAAAWAALTALTPLAVLQGPAALHAAAAVMPFFSPWTLPAAPDANSVEPYVMLADVSGIRVAVANLDAGTLSLQVLGIIVSALPAIAMGVFVVLLCERIMRRSPFAEALIRMSWIGAGIFLVAGFVGQLLSGLAGFRIATIAFDLIRSDDPSAELPPLLWPAAVAPRPLWGALALGVLAVLIRHGARLQKDTEGLV
jgi:hypothetical protein